MYILERSTNKTKYCPDGRLSREQNCPSCNKYFHDFSITLNTTFFEDLGKIDCITYHHLNNSSCTVNYHPNCTVKS